MTYKEAYEIVEDALMENCGWIPAKVFEALDKLEELIKPPESDSGVAIQTYCMAGIPVDPDIDARMEELARKARERD